MSQEIPALHRLEGFLIKIDEDRGILMVHTVGRLITCFSSLPEKHCLGAARAVARRIKPHRDAPVLRLLLSGGEKSM